MTTKTDSVRKISLAITIKSDHQNIKDLIFLTLWKDVQNHLLKKNESN